MTYKEKILQAFPNARFMMYPNNVAKYTDDLVPSVCPYDLGLIAECGTGIACSTCDECWELEADDADDDD